MTTRQTPELVPATERQVSFLASLAVKLAPEPMATLAIMLADLNIIDLNDQEREGFICKERASKIITQLKREDEKRVANL